MTIATSSELLYYRSQPHRTNLWLSFYRPRTFMSAQVTGSYSTGDRSISYYNVTTGSSSVLYADMTVLVGTTPGSDDAGRIRLRSATSSAVSVAENAINWFNGQYLTFIDYVTPEAIYPRIIQDPSNQENVIFYKDYDIPYSNQNTIYGTFVCAGSHRAMFLESGTATAFYTATGTYNVASQSLTYSWIFDGGSPTGSTSYTPGNVTYANAGHYKTRLRVTAANGAIDDTYRYVSVYDRPGRGANVPPLRWELQSLSGSRSEGGYTASIKIYEDISYVEPNALVVIFADNWFGGTRISIGGNATGNSSIVFVGYVIGSSIKFNWEHSYVEFEVGSISELMKNAEGFSVSCESKASPSTWFELYEMTVPKAMYHYLRWHSTILKTTDFQYTGDDRLVQYFDSDRSSLYDAVDSFMRDGMLGSVISDRQGKLWSEISSFGLEDPFTTIPTVFTFHKQDWIETPTIEEKRGSQMSFVELGGIAYYGVSSNLFSTLLSNAPSTVPLYRGKSESPHEGLILNSQSQLNKIAGNFLAHHNAPFPTIQMSMSGNYNNLDIAPIAKTKVVIDQNDSVRGKSLQDLYYIVDGMEWNYNSRNEQWRPDVQLVQIASGTAGQTVLIPPVPPEAGFSYPEFNLPPLPTYGNTTPVGPQVSTSVIFHDTTYGLVYTDTFDSGSPQYITVNAGLTQAQYQAINGIQMCPNGAIYVGCFGTSAGTFVARAASIGSPFVIIDDATTIAARYGGSGAMLHGLAVNPNVSEQVCYIVQTSVSTAKVRLGAGTTFSDTYSMTDVEKRSFADAAAAWHRLKYSMGSWMFFGWDVNIGAPTYVWKLNSTASGVTTKYACGGIDFTSLFIVAGQSGKGFFVEGFGVPRLMGFTNNDVSSTATVSADTDIHYQGMAMNPDGTQIMTRYGAGNRGKSTDGGYTWTLIPTLPFGSYVFAYAGSGAGVTSAKWIAAGAVIRYSPDYTTWFNKEGNYLTAISAIPAINLIYVVGAENP